MRKLALATLAALAVTTGVPAPSHAADPRAGGPVGTVTLATRSAAVGVGYTWGDGTLHFRGHTYRFGVKGLDVGAVGESRVTGHGKVYGMTSVRQFSGTYAALTGEATIGRGEGGQYFRNAAGVVLEVDNLSNGGMLQGSADGFELTLR